MIDLLAPIFFSSLAIQAFAPIFFSSLAIQAFSFQLLFSKNPLPAIYLVGTTIAFLSFSYLYDRAQGLEAQCFLCTRVTSQPSLIFPQKACNIELCARADRSINELIVWHL
jgi:hypothetical protein